MKSQNRDLKFQLVMAGDDASLNHQYGKEEKALDTQTSRSEVEETKLLKGEVRELKRLLTEADSKNLQLTRLVEQLKQRSVSLRLSSGSHTKTTSSHNSLRKNSSVKVRHEESDFKVKKEKEKPFEVDLLSDEKDQKLQNNESSNIVFPRLDQVINRSAPITSTMIYRRAQEPLSLPMLQGLPGNRNMALRQKRARANHVRRQKSNKNVTLMTAATATSNR